MKATLVKSHKRNGRAVKAHSRKQPLKVVKSLSDVDKAKLEAKKAQNKEAELNKKLEELTKKFGKK
jgi:hypothetical protein